jgi:hypothetical protein
MTKSKVLNIIVEGPTECEFVKDCMAPYWSAKQILEVRPIGLETSPGHKGGDVRYLRFKSHVERVLRGKEDMIVTSLIDFYQLRSDFPKYEAAQKISDKIDRVAFLEQACLEDIGDYRFVPYIQLHEFEALLFTKWDGFEFCGLSASSRTAIQAILQDYPNPELINDHPETAPSKRLIQLFAPAKYKKPFHGNFIALENGFETILEKCPRFKAWIDRLEKRLIP